MNDIVRNPPIDGFGRNILPTPKQFDKIADVPTQLLATRFVGMLIMAKGDISKWQAASEMLIRELRGEPHQR